MLGGNPITAPRLQTIGVKSADWATLISRSEFAPFASLRMTYGVVKAMSHGPVLSSVPASGAQRPARFGDIRSIVGLLVLAAAIHGWLIWHTELPASDSVEFIHYAWRLEHEPWAHVLRSSAQHPGYPVAILLFAKPVCGLLGGANCQSVLLAAQLADSICACVLVVPMFLLGRSLFGPRTGLWTAALFQCLPAFARSSADALSEGPFLLTAGMALYFAVRALGQRSFLCFAWCGVFGGLAYLVRPEGALCIAAAGAVLIGMQFYARSRQTWPRVILQGACLGLTALAITLPYMLTIGRLTSKPTANRILQIGALNEPDQPGPEVAAAIDGPPMACILALWWNPHDFPLWHSLQGTLWELLRAGCVVGVLFLPVGFWWYRRGLRARPEAVVLLLTSGVQAVVVWRVAYTLGYASQRHMLFILMGVLYWAVAALLELTARLWAARQPETPPNVQRWATILLGVICAAGLPKSLEPLHPDRVGNRAAGRWLAEHAAPDDTIVDPFEWSYYYSGRLFTGAPAQTAPDAHHACYVVMDRKKNLHGQADELETVAHDLLPRGRLVYDWLPPSHSRWRPGEVQIYLVPPADSAVR